MSIFDPVFRLFEGWIDPFKSREAYEPPNRLLGYVWYYVGQVKWAFVALLIYGFANALVEATVFSYVGKLVDVLTQFEASGSRASGWDGLLATHGSTLLVMLLVVLVLRATVVTFGALIEEQVIVPGFFVMMRWQSHKHVIGQSLSFFQNDLAGRISQKVFQSGMATGDMMISLLQVIWFVVVYAITTAGLLMALDWQLGLVVVIWMGIFYAIARYFIPRVRDHARVTADTGSAVSGRMVDSYANIQTVKLHASQISEDDWVLQATKEHRAALIKFTRTLTGMRVSLTVVNGMVMSVIGWIAIDLWLSGQSTLGSVAFVLALTLRLHLLSNRLLGNLNGFFRNVGVTQNTMELVAQPYAIQDRADAKDLDVRDGRLSFEHVSFDYGTTETILHDIHFDIKPGERVGIVGPSGSGKTTLVHLAMRFFDPTNGAIRIDGQNIAECRQDSVRKRFSFVQQDVQLFHRSVYENIAYGMEGATPDKVEQAAKLAHADEFIAMLKDNTGRTGYEARVGERGVKLSGGQRQRLAIARAILRDAPFFILDEATSQLDSVVEAQIQSNMFQQMQGRTVIVIAHRLSTVLQMDRIFVMEAGKIIGSGNHDALLSENSLYMELWRKQSLIGENA